MPHWHSWREDLVLLAGIGIFIWGAASRQVELAVAATGVIASRAAIGRDRRRRDDDE